MATKKCWKQQEFIGSSSLVTSASFGQKSGRLMTVGGDDGSLQLWHVGSTNCIMTLPALTSSVQSTKFNQSEEILCAGSKSGFLRIYDLSTSKVLRHLSGHKAAIRGIDFHPYGDFLASCSDDHKARMWDIRRKGCIYTYKDHTDKINCVQFSPDGKWIAATSDDNTCKIWDITAGKLLHELKDHNGPVKCLQFHPREFLLATGSTDRTSKVYDVEQFKLLTTSGLESNPIEKVAFADTGEHLYTASQDCFKLYSWEPKCLHLDTVLVKWARPADLFVSSEKLMGCSYSHNLVSVHVIDLKSLNYDSSSTSSLPATGRHLAPPAVAAAAPSHQPFPASSRRNQEEKSTAARRQSSYSPSRSNRTTSITRSISQTKERQQHINLQAPHITSQVPHINCPHDDNDVQDPHLAFKPKNTLSRSPTRELHIANQAAGGQNAESALGTAAVVKNKRSQASAKLAANFNIKTTTSPPPSPPTQVGEPNSPHRNKAREPLGGAFNWAAPHHGESPALAPPVANTPTPAAAAAVGPPPTEPPAVAAPVAVAPAVADRLSSVQQQNSNVKIATVVPMERDNPAGLDMNAFLPVKKDRISSPHEPQALNDAAVVDEICKGFHSMDIVLNNRHKNLEIVRAIWSSGDIMTAVNTAMSMRDQSLVIDLLNVLNLKQTLWNLDLCTLMLPHIKDLIISKYETYVNVGCASLRLVLKNFSHVIKANIQPPPSSAIDLSREERHRKCSECYATLVKVRAALESKEQMSGKLGSKFRELKLLIAGIE